MKNFLIDFFSNSLIVSAYAAGLVAQLLKFILVLIVDKKLTTERLFGDGGMPSGHSATVCGLATAAFLDYGAASPVFAISFVFMQIVLHDAHNVRYESGKHAEAINEIRDLMKDFINAPFDEQKLKAMLGHTRLQIFCGAVVGICTAVILHFSVYR